MVINFRAKVRGDVYRIAKYIDDKLRHQLNEFSIRYASSHTQALVALSRAVGIMTAEMYTADGPIMIPSIISDWCLIIRKNSTRGNPDEFSTAEDIEIVSEFTHFMEKLIRDTKTMASYGMSGSLQLHTNTDHPIELTLSRK